MFVCIFLRAREERFPMRGGSVNKVANESATDKKKKDVSFTCQWSSKASIQRREGVEGVCVCVGRKHKGRITKYSEISFAKRLLPAAVIFKST